MNTLFLVLLQHTVVIWKVVYYLLILIGGGESMVFDW